MTTAADVVDTLSRSARRLDDRRRRRRGARAAGVVARTWATAKLAVVAPLSPLLGVGLLYRATVNHLRVKHTMGELPAVIAGISRGGALPAEFGRLGRLDATAPWIITSDLHRCVAGRLDLVGQQDDRELYAAMLDWYSAQGFGLIENGDVEDFWMVGGSVWGTVYDLLRLAGATLAGQRGDELRQATYRTHLGHVVADNAAIYERIATRFGRAGRYHRTIGNHDDVFEDERLAARLSELTGATVSSWLVLDGPDGTEAVITHGHLVDAWNAPGRATLGKLSTWAADMVRDAPVPFSPDDVAPPRVTRELLAGRHRNGLLRVNPRFGASKSYDSLDEELLFDAFGGAAGVGPWIVMGHTHFPVVEPVSDTGARWWRYVNSGHGTGAGLVTGLEWPGGAEATSRRPRLVAWCWGDHPGWSDLLGGTEPTVVHDGRPVMRVELAASRTGRRLVPVQREADRRSTAAAGRPGQTGRS